MQPGFVWKITWSVMVAALTLFTAIAVWFHGTLPFSVEQLRGHSMIVQPKPGIAFPTGLIPGESIDLSAQSNATRAAIMGDSQGSLAGGVTYILTVHRPQGEAHIPVTTVILPLNSSARVTFAIEAALSELVLGIMALLLLWRGEGRAAFGLVLYCTSYVIGQFATSMYASGAWIVVMLCAIAIGFIGARIGFYIMADALVGERFSSGVRRLFRWGFVLMLAFGFSARIGRYMHFIFTGSAQFLSPVYSLPFSFTYLVPFVLLTLGYLRVEPEMRIRLRWVVVGMIALAATVLLNNAIVEQSLVFQLIDSGLYVFSILSMAYALLRHRVVDFSIVIDRALVYGLVTTLVIGVVAAVNSLVLRLTLPAGTSLLLQVLVPLSLGIILGRVRSVLDRVVEQVFFRKKYLSEQALRDFAERAGYIDKTADLFDATVREVSRYTRTTAVAIYSAEPGGFRCMRQTGAGVYPAALGSNDDAAVALKARREAVDLDGLASALGTDSCVFPLLVLGNLRGLLVVANRPDEHFGSDEKALLTQVAQAVGAAWRVLRARDNEALVSAMAQDSVPPDAAFAEARRLALAWVGRD
jgi:GAF domain